MALIIFANIQVFVIVVGCSSRVALIDLSLIISATIQALVAVVG